VCRSLCFPEEGEGMTTGGVEGESLRALSRAIRSLIDIGLSVESLSGGGVVVAGVEGFGGVGGG